MKVSKEELEEIILDTKERIKDFSDRNGKSLTAPYPQDTPCYYCEGNLGMGEESRMCLYCINNADNKLTELL
jgi:hypothetical protein